MIVTNASAGNPWHGRLGAGSIELVPGTPVTSITVDGVEHTVKSVTGNLGNTRYLKAPGLAAPTTPDMVAAEDGEFLADAVLFSDEYRYSPLCTEKVVASAGRWLLFDDTEQRWRKMAFGATQLTLSNTPGSPSPAGTPAVEITLHRGILFGEFDRLDGESTGDSETFLDSFELPLTYSYTPLTRPSSYPYDPTTRSVSIAVRPDGRAILVRLEAMMWNGYGITDSPGISGPITVYDDSHPWIFNVWEVVFNDDGSVASTPVEVWPDVANVTSPVGWVEYQITSISSIFYVYGLEPGGNYVATYWVTCTFAFSSNYDVLETLDYGYETSIIVNADYDKDGTKRLHYFRMASYPTEASVRTADTMIGSHQDTVPFDPEDFIPAMPSISTAVFHHEPNFATYFFPSDYGGRVFVNWAAVSVDVDPNAICGVYEDGTALKTWTTQPPDTLSWRWKTNNVTELYTGTTSHLRIGPGDVDDTAIAASGYASFNPRTGVVISSASPIGFV
jgi:hypothetical protein